MALSSSVHMGGATPLSGSIQSAYQIVHDNANVAASADLSPNDFTQAGAKWCTVSQGITKIAMRLRVTSGDAETTAPVVSVFTSHENIDNAGTPSDTTQFNRVASGVTLAVTEVVDDDTGGSPTYGYCADSDLIDLGCARSFIVIVTTQGAGSATAAIQAKPYN